MVLLQMDFNYKHVAQDMLIPEYFYTIYIPVMVWIVMLVVLFIFLLWKYTFGHWTEEKPNPYQDETLGLPRGIFRGVLTLSLLFVAVIMEISNLRLGNDESNMTGFLTAFQMMIAFYFGSKVMHHITSTERKKAAYQAEAVVQVNSNNSGSNVASSSSSSSASTIEEQMAAMYASDSEYNDEEAAG